MWKRYLLGVIGSVDMYGIQLNHCILALPHGRGGPQKQFLAQPHGRPGF